MSSSSTRPGSQLPGGPRLGGGATATPTFQSQLNLNLAAIYRLVESTSYETRGTTVGMFVEKREWEMLIEWVKEAAERVANLPTEPEATRKDIEDIKKNVAQLCRVLQGPAGTPKGPQGPRTWASVAAGPQTNAHVPTTLTAEAKALQEVIVTIPDEIEKDRTSVGQRSTIFHKIQGLAPSAGIVGLCRLRSGDWKVQTASRGGAETLRKNKAWLTGLSPSALITRPNYPVLVHGVSKAEIVGSQEDIQQIITDNVQYHKNLDITSIKWPYTSSKSGLETQQKERTHGSIIVDCTTPEAANAIIQKGISIGKEIRMAERFVRECRVLQCFNCYKYGHMAKGCTNAAYCGHCAGAHKSDECIFPDEKDKEKCCNCDKKGHKAWSQNCPLRQKESQRARNAYTARPRLYATGSLFSFSSSPPQFDFATSNTINSSAPIVPSKRRNTGTTVDTDGFQTVAKPVGRPRKVPAPTPSQGQLPLSFPQWSQDSTFQWTQSTISNIDECPNNNLE
jgi:hypothetical protein